MFKSPSVSFRVKDCPKLRSQDMQQCIVMFKVQLARLNGGVNSERSISGLWPDLATAIPVTAEAPHSRVDATGRSS